MKFNFTNSEPVNVTVDHRLSTKQYGNATDANPELTPFESTLVGPGQTVNIEAADGFVRVRRMTPTPLTAWEAAALETSGDQVLTFVNNFDNDAFVQYKLVSRQFMYSTPDGQGESFYPPFEQVRVGKGTSITLGGTTGWSNVKEITPVADVPDYSNYG